MINTIDNNKATVIGSVEDELVFNHEIYGEKFYMFTLSIPRLSEINDHIKVMISERLLEEIDIKEGGMFEISGQFRSYNNYEATGSRLVLTVFTKKIEPYDLNSGENTHHLMLDGYICKAPTYRVTPFGREIADILIAVNRSYNKSDYIPAIAWGRNAKFCKDAPLGTRIKLTGRIQSREYTKHIDEENTVTKTAFEVSIAKMEFVFEEEQ